MQIPFPPVQEGKVCGTGNQDDTVCSLSIALQIRKLRFIIRARSPFFRSGRRHAGRVAGTQIHNKVRIVNMFHDYHDS